MAIPPASTHLLPWNKLIDYRFTTRTTESKPILSDMLFAKQHSSARHLKPGVYTPLPTFFNEDEELNLEEYKKHLIRKCSWLEVRLYSC